MKTCVFIMGTNGTGKTSVARELISIFGGVLHEEETGSGKISVCRNEKVVFAGRYNNVKFGGVDNLGRTCGLPHIASSVFLNHDILVCEGMYMGSFGNNLTQTIYQADARLIVLLYASIDKINERLLNRSGRGITQAVISKQSSCLNAAKKYGESGCEVMSFDTDSKSPETIANEISKWIIRKK